MKNCKNPQGSLIECAAMDKLDVLSFSSFCYTPWGQALNRLGNDP